MTVESVLDYYEIRLTGKRSKIIGSHNTKAGAETIRRFLSNAPAAVLAAYGVEPKA